jgi:hypothetical protein
VAEGTLSRARAGDEEAFRELIDPYRGELQLHCYRILGSAQDAGDLLQDGHGILLPTTTDRTPPLYQYRRVERRVRVRLALPLTPADAEAHVSSTRHLTLVRSGRELGVTGDAHLSKEQRRAGSR